MAQQPIVYDAAQDLVDQLVGLKSDDATYAVRHQRDKVAAATQGSYDALFDPALPGLTLAERLLVALYAARLTPAPELAAHYRQRATTPAPAPPTSNWPSPASRRTPPTRAWPPSWNSRAS